MPDDSINIELSLPPYPEGAEMTPSQFGQWLVENLSFKASGAFLSGQVEGARPTSNVGLFINGRKIEVWSNGKYRSLLSVPIGAMMPWPCRLLTPPDDDFLFCDGQLVLKADFPDLATAIGDTWKATGDDSLYFRLPDTRGRIPAGAGTGIYNPLKDASKKDGDITARNVGEYFGYEWGIWQVPTQPNAPAGRFRFTPMNGSTVARTFNGKNYTGVLNPSFVTRWLIRAK